MLRRLRVRLGRLLAWPWGRRRRVLVAAVPQQSRAADVFPPVRSHDVSLSRRPPLSSVRAKSSGARCPPRLAASRSASWPERRSVSCHQGSWCHSSVFQSRARAHSVSLRRTFGALLNFISSGFIRFHSIAVRTAAGSGLSQSWSSRSCLARSGLASAGDPDR